MTWRSWLYKIGGIVVFLVLGLLIYQETFDSVYHLDDFFFIKGNPGIRDITQWQNYGKGVIEAHSRYAVFATFAFNYAIHNIEVFGYHVVNFIIHVLTSLGVWWLALLLLRTKKFVDYFSVKERFYLAFFVGLLFLTHPVNTQAVTYISQRFASMATLFYVWALAMYIYARKFSSQQKQVGCYLLAGLLLMIAAMSKEITITFPLMVLFFEMFVLHDGDRFNAKNFLKKNWFIVLVLLGVALFIPYKFGFYIKQMLFSTWHSESHEGDVLTFWTYQMTQWRVWVVFLRLIFLPINQNLDYDFPMSKSLFDPWHTVFNGLFLISLLVFFWRKRKQWPHMFIGLMWFYLTLLVNFIPRSHVIFEHKLYLSMIGMLFAFVVSLALLFRKKTSRIILLSGCVLVLSLLTFQRNKVWESEVSLWSDVIKKSPNKYRVNLNLGKAYVEEGKLGLALKYLNRALELKPKDEKALNNRGLVYHKLGEYQKALDDFNVAAESASNYVEVYNNRGVVYKDLGKYEEAVRDYKIALQLNPQQAETYNNLGVILRKQKRYEEALNALHTAFKLKFNKYPDALLNIGNVYRDMGDINKAVQYYNNAIKLNWGNPIYFANRANAFNDLGMKQNAYDDYTKAISLSPKQPTLYLARGLFLQNEKKLQEAAQDYARAINLDPKNLKAYNNIGVVFYELKQYDQAMNVSKKALELHPRLPSGFYVLIMSCYESGKKEECQQYVDLAKQRGLNFDKAVLKRIDEFQNK